MHALLSLALPLALAGSALANPLMRRDDACLAAVTGYAALGDPAIRKAHCSSFITTIVTPAAKTVTVTVTDAPKLDNGWNGWKREIDERDVTVCPNEVPNYASACNTAGYKSACGVWGVTGETTYTIPARTITKTVYVGGYCTSTAVITSTVSACSGGTTTKTVTSTSTTTTGSSCPTGPGGIFSYTGPGFCSPTTTVTSTTTTSVGSVTSVTTTTTTTTKSVGSVTTTTTTTATAYVGPGSVSTSTTTTTSISTTTLAAVTVTVTATSGTSTPSNPSGNCLSASQAQAFVDAFTDLLEYTSYNGTSAAPGRGYHYNVSAKYLASDFTDYSDSINWMAGFPLKSVTFGSRAAFDYGQGFLQPELKMTTLSMDFSCKTIHWRWSALTSTYANVRGINYMVISDDLTQIKTNYAEFNNADWIQSFAPYNPSISCVVPGGLTKSAKRSLPHTY